MAVTSLNPQLGTYLNGVGASTPSWNIHKPGWYRITFEMTTTGQSNLPVLVKSSDYTYGYEVKPPMSMVNGVQYNSVSDDAFLFVGVGTTGTPGKFVTATATMYHTLYLEQGDTLFIVNSSATVSVDYVGKHLPHTEWTTNLSA